MVAVAKARKAIEETSAPAGEARRGPEEPAVSGQPRARPRPLAEAVGTLLQRVMSAKG